MNSKVISTKKQKWLKVLEYSLPALISIFVYVFAMLCKGISPFGKESICYIDCSDGLIPAYTGLWDWLHGRSSFMVSFNLGAGGSLFSSFVLNGFLSPLSWIIGIFPRESIIYGISLLFIVRFALMATTAYFCFKKFFPKISQWFLLLFAIVWTFSGWTMVHFTNIGWLDLMILLPLLILSAKELVENGKIMWFVIVLSYMLILSYYITYMVLVGTVVIATVYIFTACEKGKRMKVASLLFYGIFISLLISMVTFIPSMVTSLGGHRFSSTANNDKAELYKYFFSKLAVVIMYALPVVFFMRLMFKYKQDKKNVLFFMLSFVICGVGLIIEPINKMWHTGSYYCFPLRYGFVLIMLMIFASLYYIDKFLLEQKQPVAVKQEKEINVEEGEEIKPAKKKYFDVVNALLIPFLGLSVMMMAFCMWIGVSIQLLRSVTFTSFCYYFFLFALSYAAIELSLRVKTDKLTFGNIKGGVLIFTLCMLQVVMLMTGYLGASYVDRFDKTSRVQNAFNIDTKELENGYKLKDREHLYNLNFPYLVDYASMSSWIHISSEQQYQAYHHLGYNTFSTTLYSSGGTYMTDLLLGNRYVLSDKVLDDSYYTFLKDFDYVDSDSGETKKVNLYELKLETRKAFTTNVDLVKLLEDKEDLIEIQNIIYKAIFSQDTNIMNKLDVGIVELEDKFVITVFGTQGKILYLNTELSIDTMLNDNEYDVVPGLNDYGVNITNDVEIIIPKSDTNKDQFKKNFTKEYILSKMVFAEFDIARFKTIYENNFLTSSVDLVTTQDKIKISFDNTTGQKYLFVPYVNLKNMNATLNGKDVKVENAFYNFMVVEIESAENEIEISYSPQLVKPCLFITIGSILVFAIFCVLNHFFKLSDKKFFIWVGTIGACAILAAVGFLVYLKPFFNTFVILFS